MHHKDTAYVFHSKMSMLQATSINKLSAFAKSPHVDVIRSGPDVRPIISLFGSSTTELLPHDTSYYTVGDRDEAMENGSDPHTLGMKLRFGASAP